MSQRRDTIAAIARIAVTAAMAKEALSVVATREVVTALAKHLFTGSERKTVDQLVRKVSTDLERFASSEGIAAEALTSALSNTEVLLARHALSDEELHEVVLDPKRAADVVWGRASGGEIAMGEADEALVRRTLEATYAALLVDPHQLEALTAAYRKAVLLRLAQLADLPDDTAAAVRASLLPALVTGGRRAWRPLFPPSALLRAEHGIVPFRGREEELATLAEWCENGQEIGIRLYTGAGGMGKTRLMLRACELRRRAGWRAGFLDEEASQELFAAKALGDLFTGDKPLLLVVDYAERRRPTLERLLATLAEAYPAKPVRVVLVARYAGDWWGDLKGTGKGGGDLLRGPATALPREIRPLVPKDYERSAAFEEAVSAFATKLGKKTPDVSPPHLDDPTFDRALYLHAAALQAVLGGEPTADAAELLDFLLDREEDHLENQAAVEGLDLSKEALTQAAALATLAGPLPDVGTAAEVLSRAPRLEKEKADAIERVAELLHELYPSRAWLNGVQPDLLGEHLVEAEIDRDGRLREAALGEEVADDRREAALTVLTRSAQRRWALQPTAEARQAGRDRLQDALQVDLPGLAELALKVSVETDIGYGERSGALLGDALGEVLERSADSELACRLEAKMPETTTALRVAAEVATRLCRDALHARKPSDEEGRSELARLSSNWSVRLSRLGRREEALSAVAEAVEQDRELSSMRPEAFLPDLAMSLNNLSAALSELGRREEALSAVEEAVDHYRELSSTRPEAFLPGLAMSLNNLSAHLSSVGRRVEALLAVEGAVDHYRELSSTRPEAFLPDLALSLNNLSLHLSALGRREEALSAVEEAVDHYRELSSTRPEAFLSDLAGSLDSLSADLWTLGRREEARSAIEEAVEIRRELSSARPEAFLLDLTGSLNNLSLCLSDLGRHGEALAAIKEAVEHYRELSSTRPEVFLPDLAMSLNNLSNGLLAVGRRVEALSAIKEAVEIQRELSSTRPEAFLPGLAGCLNNLSAHLSELGRREEALSAIEEAVGNMLPFFDRHPAAFAPLAVKMQRNLLDRSAEVGREPDAELIGGLEKVFARMESDDTETGEGEPEP